MLVTLVYLPWVDTNVLFTYRKKGIKTDFKLSICVFRDLSVKNLQFLSSQQALADLANFIDAMNKKHKVNKSVKWIVFGGSYPGSLAAWVRMKYPHLVHGAVSSSAPLLAKVDFTGTIHTLSFCSNGFTNQVMFL